jgi:hypothetical protein
MPSQQTLEEYRKALAEQALRKKQTMLRRSSFTQSTAAKFKPFFDEAIRTTQNVLIEYELFYPNSAHTVYKKCTDALKYLLERYEDESGDEAKTVEWRQKYLVLRAMIICRPQHNGIMLEFKNSPSIRGIPKSIQQAQHVSTLGLLDKQHPNKWSNDLVDWIADSKGVVRFERRGLCLNEGDKLYVEKICKEAGIDCHVDLTTIIAMRID